VVQIREGYTTRRIPMYSGNVRFEPIADKLPLSLVPT
jgi:hypothetical protein